MKEFIEIPFGAKDSELGGWEYNIPEGYIASIENGKIIVKKEESEDDKIEKEIIKLVKFYYGSSLVCKHSVSKDDMVAWLEKQSAKIFVYKDTLFKIAIILSQYEDKDDSPLEKIRSIMIDGTICSMDLESKNKKQDEQKPTNEEMKILLQTEYEKGKADAIEQNTAWSEEDERMVEDVIEAIDTNYAVSDYNEMVDWLKSLKDRVQLKYELKVVSKSK